MISPMHTINQFKFIFVPQRHQTFYKKLQRFVQSLYAIYKQIM